MKILLKSLAILLSISIFSTNVYAEVDWSYKKELKLDEKPIASAMAADGSALIVLVKGAVLIYPTSGAPGSDPLPPERIPIDKGMDSLSVSPQNDIVLSSSRDKKVKLLRYELSKEIDVTGLPVIGNPDAPVTIVAFDDYQCPYCARLEPTLKEVLKKHPKDVKLVIKNFPLNFHKYARKAAAFALAADRQGKFEEFHTKLFENSNTLSDAKVEEIAKGLGLDIVKLKKDMADPAIERQISKDIADGAAAGVRGTPTVFINGKLLKQRGVEGMEELIRAALKKGKK